jgi:riboflavin kinase/FMN adenylyltransferase
LIYLCADMRVFTDLGALPRFQKAVVTIGSFDGVHFGHRQILRQVHQLAEQYNGESVVITFDPHPRTVLRPDDAGFRLITDTAEKISLLENAGIDNTVVVPFSIDFSQLSAEAYVTDFLWKKFEPRCIVIGHDHRFGHDRTGDIAFLRAFAEGKDLDIVEIPAHMIDEVTVSSTKIRKALDSTQIDVANRLMGHPFTLSGTVVEGNRIGRSIGFPTANIRIEDPHKLILPDGIYAAQTLINGRTVRGMLYIGKRPTIEGAAEQRIEVNLLDFDGDLYGQYLRIDVLAFIRGDRQLDSLEALQAQINEDKNEIVSTLDNLEATKKTIEKTDVAIVILNYNTRKHLETYLPSVVKYSAGARIVVADNGSPDDSMAFVRANFPAIQVLDLGTNYGFAEGYNQALKQVKADIYVILNSDVEVTEGWMQPALDLLYKDPKVAVVQPKILAWRNKSRFEHAGAAGGWLDVLGYPFCRGRLFGHVEEDNGQYDTAQPCFWAAGAAFFIRAPLYHIFGGFDGDYFAHNEEIDLCWRLRRAGYTIWCTPQAVVYHLGGGTLDYESPRKVFLNFRNSLFSILKNEPTAKALWLIPTRLMLDGAAGLMFAAKRQWASIGSILKAHYSFYSHFNRTIQKRRAINTIIQQHRIGSPERSAIYKGSIVVQHYLRRIKNFSQL